MPLLFEVLIASLYEPHTDNFFMFTQCAGSERRLHNLEGNKLVGGTRDNRQLAARNNMLISSLTQSNTIFVQ